MVVRHTECSPFLSLSSIFLLQRILMFECIDPLVAMFRSISPYAAEDGTTKIIFISNKEIREAWISHIEFLWQECLILIRWYDTNTSANIVFVFSRNCNQYPIIVKHFDVIYNNFLILQLNRQSPKYRYPITQQHANAICDLIIMQIPTLVFWLGFYYVRNSY